MKKFRKIMAVLVAAMMIMATMVPAWAATTKKEITITYEPGTGSNLTSGVKDTDTVEIPANSSYTLFDLPDSPPDNYSVPEGKKFLGWGSTNAAVDQPNQKLFVDTDPATLTLYAIWGNVAEDSGNNQTLTNTGSIVIEKGAKGEKYTAYELFRLFSWKDTDPRPDQHVTTEEAYSYYICEDHPLYATVRDFKLIDGTTPAFELATTRKITISDQTWVPIKATAGFMNSTTDENEPDEYTDPLTTAEVQRFAKQALSDFKTAIAGGLTDAQVAAFTTKSAVADANGDATITPLKLGYYVVDSTLGSLCALDTTTGTVKVVDKNSLSSTEKKVQENSTGIKGDKNDASFGEIVNYETTIKIPQRASNVVYHDYINTNAFELKSITVTSEPAGVTYTLYNKDGSNIGTATATAYEEEWIDDDDHSKGKKTVAKYIDNNNTPAVSTDDVEDTFAVVFTDSWTENMTADATVTIAYTAMLKTTATVGSQSAIAMRSGNDNVSYLTYGDAQKSAYDWTRTYTWDFEIFKYADSRKANPDTKGTGDYATEKAAHEAGYISNSGVTDAATDQWIEAETLGGAGFEVYKITTTRTPSATPGGEDTYTESTPSKLTFKLVGSAGTGTNPTTYRLAIAGDEDTTTTLVSPPSGRIIIQGIDACDENDADDEDHITTRYQVKEITAPTGYDKLHENIDVKLSSGTKTAALQQDNNAGMITNNTVALSWKGTSGGDYAVKQDVAIKNYTGTEMPMTGGMGTTVLYIVGGMLVILAGAYLFFSRKKAA